MKIGVDLDGVLVNIDDEFAHRVKREGHHSDPSTWTDYYIEKNHPELPDQWFQRQFDDPTFWINAKPYEDAWHVINKWFFGGDDIFFVTSRPKMTAGVTFRWLDEWRINYNRVIFAPKTTKASVCEILNLDVMIEDDPDEIVLLNENFNGLTIMRSRPYNGTVEFVITTDSFYDLDEEFKKWKQDLSVLDAKQE